LQVELARDGTAALHARLRTVDPRSAARIHPHDPQRILRALEVYAQTGVALSVLQDDAPRMALNFLPIPWVLAPTVRAALHARLAQRFLAMLARGFLNEVAGLRARADLTLDTPALRAVGYRAAWRHLAGELTHAAMVDNTVVATRQLAKRQLTWFRAVPGAQCWDSEDPRIATRLVDAFARHVASRAGLPKVHPQFT
jgi:tRNA dimethylallyltransferase